jgi:hypothetical protein
MPLGMDAEMIDVGLFADIGARLFEQAAPTPLQFGAKPIDAIIFNQEKQACASSRFTEAMIAKDADDVSTQPGRFIGFDKNIQILGWCESPGSLLAAHKDVEPVDLPAFKLPIRRH